MEECEKEGDRLHWLLQNSPRGGPGIVQRDGTKMI